MNYMKNGPPSLQPGQAEAAEKKKRGKAAKKRTPCPELGEGLRCDISNSSMRYILHNYLGLDYKYTKKRGVFMSSPKRHTRIRKFMIEFSRALQLEAQGTHVVVFTDETYIHQNHGRLASWVSAEGDGSAGKTAGKGKRLIILHAITRLGFLCETDPVTDFPISEPALERVRDSRNTAEWVWPAKSKFKDYHDNMDGEGFEWWLANRLIPAFTARYGPEKKMILVMDNASYHHQLNTNYYPEKKTPANASKSLNAHVLRKAGCNAIKVPRPGTGGTTVLFNFLVPAAEPEANRKHREEGGHAPGGGAHGTVYCRGGAHGPSDKELTAATVLWLTANKPEALDSKVEALFREKGWGIVWTPPYCPKFQPIELVWGAGKQRASGMYYPGRDLTVLRLHLRMGFYGGTDANNTTWDEVNIAGAWETAEKEMNAWIKKDIEYVADGLTGTITDLRGAEAWTSTGPECLDCADMDLDADPPPPDVTATTLPDMSDEQEDPEGEEGELGSQDEGEGEDEGEHEHDDHTDGEDEEE
jgi:transposase